jgi:hypothetical protein
MSTSDLVEITQKYIDDTTIAIGVSSTFWESKNSILDKAGSATVGGEPQWVADARDIIENKHPTLDWLLGGSNSHLNNFKFTWTTFQGNAEDAIIAYMNSKYDKTSTETSFDIKSYVKQQHESDFILPTEWLPIELGRGCQFKCKFCGEANIGKKKGTYIRDMECIRRELIENYERYGTTNYFFIDDTVNEDTDKIKDLADLVQKLPFKLSWVGYNRLDLIWSKPEQISILKDSGLVSTFFGIETFHPKASMIIGKGFMGKHGKDFLCDLRNKWGSDISYHLSFIIGLPYETPDDIQETVDWLAINDFAKFTSWLALYINPNYPNTEFARNYGLYGYKFPNKDNEIYWENKHWTYSTARQQSIKLEANKKVSCPGGFILGAACSLGYDIKEIQYRNMYDNDFVNERNSKLQHLVQQYVQKSKGC